MTRFLLMLSAIGVSLMLLGGTVLPVTEGDDPPLGLGLLTSSIERVKELIGG